MSAGSKKQDPAYVRRAGPFGPGAMRWCYLILAVIALSEIAVHLLFPADHAHFWFEDLPAWGSLYGLVSCVVIIKVSKWLGHLWLMRPEDYYDR